MVKKNNNAWIVYVVALIAIVALILAAVAVNKANMTGNSLWTRLFQKQEKVEANAPDVSQGVSGEDPNPDAYQCGGKECYCPTGYEGTVCAGNTGCFCTCNKWDPDTGTTSTTGICGERVNPAPTA